MNRITLTHLRYFEALARLGHFTRAAEDCAISQPALSMQIKELEAHLGAPLVERGGRQIFLTPLGEEIAARARDVLRAVHDLRDVARQATGPLGGRLRLGAIPTVAPYLLPAVMTALGAALPAMRIDPLEAVTRRLIDDLIAARLDLAIVALPVGEPALTEYPLFSEDFVLVRPAGDAALPVPDADGLREMRLWLLEEGHCFRDQALSFCSAGGAAPRGVMEGSSLSTLVQMVGAGIGVTLVPEMALALEIPRANVAVARLPAPAPGRRIGMVWRQSNPRAPAFAEIATMIGRIAREQNIGA